MPTEGDYWVDKGLSADIAGEWELFIDQSGGVVVVEGGEGGGRERGGGGREEGVAV